MGRRKLPIEFIKNDKSRKETFKKRMKGLKGKAQQLATLCNAMVGVIVICDGKVHDAGFGGNVNTFDEIVYKYRRFSMEKSRLIHINKILDPTSTTTPPPASCTTLIPGGIDLNNLPGMFPGMKPTPGALCGNAAGTGAGAAMTMENLFCSSGFGGYLPASVHKLEDDAMSNSSIGTLEKPSLIDQCHAQALTADSHDCKSTANNNLNSTTTTSSNAGVTNVNQCCNLDMEHLAHYPSPFQGDFFHESHHPGMVMPTTGFVDANAYSMIGNGAAAAHGLGVHDGVRAASNYNFFYDPHGHFQFNNLDGALEQLDFDKSMPTHWDDEPVDTNISSSSTTTSGSVV